MGLGASARRSGDQREQAPELDHREQPDLRDGSKGISLYQVDAAAGCRTTWWSTTPSSPGRRGRALRIGDGSTGNTVLNNILTSANPNASSIDINSGDLSGLTSDYNVLGFVLVDSSGVGGLSGWKSNYGQDKHSFTSSLGALFANPSGNDFHLTASSPAVDIGISTRCGPATDLAGNRRPVGNGYDIGAYEYQGASASAPAVTAETPMPSSTGISPTHRRDGDIRPFDRRQHPDLQPEWRERCDDASDDVLQ